MKNYDGIGIHVDEKAIAIVLDHCIKGGKLTAWVSKIVSHFKNTYIETSPNGTELRIIPFASDRYTYDKNTYYIKESYVGGMLLVQQIVL